MYGGGLEAKSSIGGSFSNSALFQVPSVKAHPRALESGPSLSHAEALIADDPELQKRIRKLEACLRVRSASLFFSAQVIETWSASAPVRSSGENDSVLEMVSGASVGNDSVFKFASGENDTVTACEMRSVSLPARRSTLYAYGSFGRFCVVNDGMDCAPAATDAVGN